MSQKKVKEIKKVVGKMQKQAFREAFDYVMLAVPRETGIDRIIFCVKLMFADNPAKFIWNISRIVEGEKKK